MIFGAARVLEGLTDLPKQIVEAKPKQICDRLSELLEEGNISNAAIALSGDSGFYSGARILQKRISERLTAEDGYDIELEILPGISSVQAFAAKLGVPWQNWNLVSAHGVDCDVVHEVMKGRETFFLTGGRYTAGVICRELEEAGLGDLKVTVGENLSYAASSSNPTIPKPSAETEAHPEPTLRENAAETFPPRTERLLTGTACDFAGKPFDDLAVILVDTKTPGGETLILPPRPFGIPDSEFIRGKVPMTKMEVRCVILGKMGVSDSDIVWDIGAGTGSVSVELAMRARQVWALERKEEAVRLIRENRKKFGRWNLHVVQGKAPEDMDKLPAPDVVFVGGSGGCLGEILERVWERNERARICISATLLETIQEGMDAFAQKSIEPDITQVAVSRAESVGGKHMMKAGNPIFVLAT